MKNNKKQISALVVLAALFSNLHAKSEPSVLQKAALANDKSTKREWTYKDGWRGVIPGSTKLAEVVKRFGPIRDDDASVPWYKTIQTRHQGTTSIYYLKNGAISVDVTEGNDYIDSIKIFDFAKEPSFPKTLAEAEKKYGQMPFVENNGHNRVFAGRGVSAECYNNGTLLSWIAFSVPATK